MNPDQSAKANAAIERLATLYPRTFFLLARYRWPLKIGIFDDLVAAGVMEPDELELALGMYCRSFGYRKAMRVGAAGGADGTVTAEHASTAKELEGRRVKYRARKEAERKAAEEATQEAAAQPIPETVAAQLIRRTCRFAELPNRKCTQSDFCS
jgi:sRNA-binding protein